MAVNEHKPLSQAVLDKDRAALLALKMMNDYIPTTPAISIDAMVALKPGCAEEHEILTTKALAAARDARTSMAWAVHNGMLSVKAAVIGQYGANSDAVQALGLKKKADYRRPARRRNKSGS